MKKKARLGLVVIGIVAATVWVANATPIELINNGDFESGFTSWNQINTGSGGITLNDGTIDPSGPLGTSAPFSGVSALTFQTGPGSHTLWQSLNLAGSYTSVSLDWVDKLDNWGSDYSDPNQEWRVELWDTSNTFLTQLFSTNPGDNLHQDWTLRNADLTAYIGGSYRLAFTQQDNLGHFNAQLDNVSVVAQVVPEPATMGLMSVFAGSIWFVRRFFSV